MENLEFGGKFFGTKHSQGGEERSQLHNHKATTLEGTQGEPQIRLALAPPRLKREVASVSPPRTRAGGGRPEMVCAWGRAMRPCPCWGWSSPPRNAMARRPDTKGTKAMAHAKG